MKFNVKITKVLEGHVEIEAENYISALSAVKQMYNDNGAELPDMEDCNPLQFSIDQPGFHYEEPKINGKPSTQDVRNYLIRNGYPEPPEALMDEFTNGGEDQEMYDEAVRNNYSMVDVHRWFNLKNVFEKPISFGAAMLIDDALWDEEYESMDITDPQSIFDTPEQICKNRIHQLIDVFNKDGTVVPNEYDVKDEDVITFAKVFDLPIHLPEAQKASLSSLIGSAESRVAPVESNITTPSKGPEL